MEELKEPCKDGDIDPGSRSLTTYIQKNSANEFANIHLQPKMFGKTINNKEMWLEIKAGWL